MINKNFFAVLLLLFISTDIFSQCDSVIIEKERTNSDGYISFSQTVTHFSSTGKILDKLYTVQDEPGGIWAVSGRDSFQYDSNDSLIFHLAESQLQFTSPSRYKYEFTYDLSGNQLTSTTSYFNGGWNISESDTNVYDTQNNLTSQIHYSIYPSRMLKSLHFYDVNQNDSSFIIQRWDGFSWIDSLREDNYYDLSGMKIEKYSMKFLSGSWDSTLITFYHYNSNSLIDTIYDQQRILGVWENRNMDIYTYGILNKQIHHYTLSWDTGTWIYITDDFTDVDQYGYLSYSELYYASYNPGLSWSTAYGSYSQINDSLGNILSWESHPIPGGPGSGSYTYTNGVLTSRGSYTVTMGGFTTDRSVNYYYEELYGDTLVCSGSANILSVDSCSGDTYLWNTGETASSISVVNSGNYQVVITRANGWQVFTPIVHVEVSAALPVVYQSTDSIANLCMGSNLVLYSLHESGVVYQWYRGGLVLYGKDENYIRLYSGNPTGLYYLIASNGCGSDTSSVTQFVINPKPAIPVITASGPLNFCDGDSLELTCSSADSYLWSIDGQTSQSIIVDSTGTYTVEVFNPAGCSNEGSINVIEHTYIPASHVIINYNTLSSNPNLTTAQWYMDGVLIPGAVQSSYTPTLPGNYSYVVSSFSGCPTYSDTVYVDPSTLNMTAGPDVWTCYGSDVRIGIFKPYLGGVPPYTYSWSAGVTDLGFGFGNVLNATANRTYTLTVTDSQGHSVSDQMNLYVYPAIPATLTASTFPFCEGNIETVELNDPTAMVQKWIVNGDTMVSGSRTYDLIGSSICQIMYLDSNTCLLTSLSDTFYFNSVVPGPHIFADLEPGYCQTGAGTFWVHPDSFTTYQWKMGQSVISTDTIVEILFPENYSLVQTDQNGCAQSTTLNLLSPTHSRVDPLLIHSGDCDSVFLEVPEIDGATYYWEFNNSVGVGNNYRLRLNSSGGYYCEITMPDGCLITSNYIWNGSGLISFSIDSLNGILFYDGPFIQGNTYQWLLNGEPITGAYNNYYVPEVPGNYSLRIFNNSFCHQYSNSIDMIACTAGVITSNTSLCIGSCTGEAFIGATGTPPFSYLWSTGATTSAINGLCSGSYSVTVTDSIGCISVADFIFTDDSINFNADVRHTTCLACDNGSILVNVNSSGNTYNVSIDPVAGVIAGDSVISLPPGNYQICVTDQFGCENCSTYTILQDPTFIKVIDQERSIVYPNPTHSQIFVIIKYDYTKTLYSIQNGIGQELISGNVESDKTFISLEELTPGFYFLLLKSEKGTEVIPVIKN